MENDQIRHISKIEKLFVKTGEIIAVRKWNTGKICELDLHLPQVNFENWRTAQSIKVRISPFHYTDYTPAMWSVADKTCTLYIDITHSGQGSNWAKKQMENNLFHYLKIEDERHLPVIGKRLVFLGDATALGHFCALQQLAGYNATIDGYITFNDQHTSNEFAKHFPWLSIQPVSTHITILDETEKWLVQNHLNKENFVFYILGNAGLIVKLRKLLKDFGIQGNQIKSKGFWH